MALHIINQATAPMQLSDFIALPAASVPPSDQLYWYEITSIKEAEISLRERSRGDRFSLLKEAVLHARNLEADGRDIETSQGCYLEFGFASGRSLNFIAGLADNALVFGFDSCNGSGPGDFPHRDFSFTRTVDASSTKLEKYQHLDYTSSFFINDQTEKPLRIELKLRTNVKEVPFIPFSPLCNVILYVGDIQHSLEDFINLDLRNERTDGEYISFLFFDINDDELLGRTLQRLWPYLSPGKTVLVADHQLTCIDMAQSPVPMSPSVSSRRLTQDNPEIGMWLKQFIQFPPRSNTRGGERRQDHDDAGNNVLHFNSKNRRKEFDENPFLATLTKRWTARGAEILYSDSQILRRGIDMAREHFSQERIDRKKLLFLEFGICSGRSMNYITSLLDQDEILYGFDSGLGLNTKWRHKFPAGTFRYTKTIERAGDNLVLSHLECSFRDDLTISTNTRPPANLFVPFIPHPKANLVLGYVEATLDEFVCTHLLGQEDKALAFIFIDTDLRTAAEHILSRLDPFIVAGKTIIVFDEALNFEGTVTDDLKKSNNEDKGKEDEWKFHEFDALKQYGMTRNGFNVLAFNRNGQQLTVTMNDHIAHV